MSEMTPFDFFTNVQLTSFTMNMELSISAARVHLQNLRSGHVGPVQLIWATNGSPFSMIDIVVIAIELGRLQSLAHCGEESDGVISSLFEEAVTTQFEWNGRAGSV
jgi:hypothetical protein